MIPWYIEDTNLSGQLFGAKHSTKIHDADLREKEVIGILSLSKALIICILITFTTLIKKRKLFL